MKAIRTLRHQRGAALLMSLLILLVMTMLAVTSTRTASLEQRMSGNNRDREIAFQAAEAALRAGERVVELNALEESHFSTTCTNALCKPATSAAKPVWKDTTLDVWNTSSRHKVYDWSDSATVRRKPQYIIEWLGYVPPVGAGKDYVPSASNGDPAMFRVTALGYGASGDARVMLQSTYQKNS